MPVPVFYNAEIGGPSPEHQLGEESSRHIVQVLRMKPDELIQVTNGKGHLFMTRIIDDNKKQVRVRIIDTTFIPQPPKISIAISLVKNTQRFEWFLEKAVEIGVSEIYPLICARTEKQQVRVPRLQNIMVSAMMQSQQVWLPKLYEPVKLDKFLDDAPSGDAFIAHCVEGDERNALHQMLPAANPIILIGPEGDFTTAEIDKALRQNYKPVTLGSTRLRTETAGLVAVTLMQNLNARYHE